MTTKIAFVPLLNKVQEYISVNYAASLSDSRKFGQLKPYIEKYLRDHGYVVEGLTMAELADKLYCEMAEYSVLTPFLGREDIEEINVNGWDDIAITYTDGHIEKTKEHFYSPTHAVDIVKRLLHHSGMIIDNATPMAQGHLPGNTRITALKDPLVDEDRGISVSIRLLHPSRVNRPQLVSGGNATQKMIDFLCMCLRYGVSFVVAGATSSGKTTLLNALLSSIPDNKRIFTIESGSRELSLIRAQDGKVTNNVVHTLSRPSENEAYDITVDNGAEFADFAQCESWGTEVFFAHPYTSWERSQNERHNGLFRAFVPKGTSMQNYSAEYILSAADELNARPRKKLGYATPEELFDSFLDRVYAVDSKPA